MLLSEVCPGDLAMLNHYIHNEFLEYHKCFNRLFVVKEVYWDDADKEFRVSLLPIDEGIGLNTACASVVFFSRTKIEECNYA